MGSCLITNKLIIVNTLECYKAFLYDTYNSNFVITEYCKYEYNIENIKNDYFNNYLVNKEYIKYTENKVILNMLNNIPYNKFDKPYNIFNTKLSNNDKIKFELIFNLIKNN